MAVVPEGKRIAELERFGASEPLVRLSSGEAVHKMFSNGSLRRPYYVYNLAGAPDGPPLIPLWERYETVFGAWERDDGPEFIEFSIETPDEFESLARTEQGFWATQFDYFYECDEAIEDLREAAAAVGFRFFDRYLSSRLEAESRLGTFDAHDAWRKEVVAGIDLDSRQR